MWYVRECDKGGRVVMGVLRRRFARYAMRKGDLFVLSWARVRRVCRGKFSSVLLTCGGCVRSILLLSLAARC